MRNFLIGLVVLIALVVGAAAWWLQDANRLKPNLERLLSEQSGAAVSIRGDLSWQLFPPIELTAESVHIDFDGDLVDGARRRRVGLLERPAVDLGAGVLQR